MLPKFPLGQVVATAAIAAKMGEHPTFQTGVMQCLDRHSMGDWGLTCEEDIVTNNGFCTSRRCFCSRWAPDTRTTKRTARSCPLN